MVGTEDGLHPMQVDRRQRAAGLVADGEPEGTGALDATMIGGGWASEKRIRGMPFSRLTRYGLLSNVEIREFNMSKASTPRNCGRAATAAPTKPRRNTSNAPPPIRRLPKARNVSAAGSGARASESKNDEHLPRAVIGDG
jgi:hypothetical protein